MPMAHIEVIFFLSVVNFLNSERIVPHSEEWAKKFTEITRINLTEFLGSPVPKDEVTFYLFSKQTKEHYVQIFNDDMDIIDEDVEKIVFLIHGWTEYREREWYQDLKNAFLRIYPDWIVIQVDYSNAALDYYHISVSNAKYVGKHIGDFIYTICRRKKISPSNIILVGHSLGSHVASFAGKEVQHLGLDKISRIVSLDPAKPLFFDRPCGMRLCKDDAEVVQVIHTDTIRYGIAEAIGSVDFYPNGGEKQKGCKNADSYILSEENLCSHHRSHQYFIEAVLYSKHFLSQRCKDWNTYVENRNKCDNVTLHMGNLNSKEEGSFYLETNCIYPFGIQSLHKSEL